MHAMPVPPDRQSPGEEVPEFSEDEWNDLVRDTRANPDVPEIGATPREVVLLCERQFGTIEATSTGGRCVLEDEALFSVSVVRGTVERVDAVFAGVDTLEIRDKLRERFGEPDNVIVDDAGFRVWVWFTAGHAFAVRTHPHGTQLTEFVIRDPDTLSDEEWLLMEER